MSWGPGGGPEQQANRKQNLSDQEIGHRNNIRFQSILMLLFSWQFLWGEDVLTSEFDYYCKILYFK